jgi:hypothetical protein
MMIIKSYLMLLGLQPKTPVPIIIFVNIIIRYLGSIYINAIMSAHNVNFLIEIDEIK